MKLSIKRLSILLIVLVLIIGLRVLGVSQYLTLSILKSYREYLLQEVSSHYLLSVMLFILCYIAVTASSLPGAAVLTLAGGLLFRYSGVFYVNIGATLGATMAFLVSRYLIGNWVQQHYKESLKKFNNELEENGKHYLLTLRLVPIFPFFLINILAGMTQVSLITFIWTTALGIIPGSFVYIYAGMQLLSIQNMKDILSLPLLLAFLFLGSLAMIPVIVKKISFYNK